MKPVDDKEETVTNRAVSRDEEGRKRGKKKELHNHNLDTIRYEEKKLIDKGVQRLDRDPVQGIGIGRPPPKSGHGGKYTWEGPDDLIESELSPVPASIDEKDPNYVDEEKEERVMKGEEEGTAGFVVGEVEVAKVALFKQEPPLSLSRETEVLFFHHSLSTPFADPSETEGLPAIFSLLFNLDSFFFVDDPRDKGNIFFK